MYFDRLAAAQLIADVIKDPTLTAGDIQICSLASTVDPHKIWNRKVATVMFSRTPSALATGASEWRFPVPGQFEQLVLDSHFLGLTVLNDVDEAEHKFDCIALSGLASHPFGSWQPKGDDKSYMWIRDTLPTSIGGGRFILYGYNTTLRNSHSFQTIVDLANTLYQTLQTNGWASPSTKPLVFLTHSLGGVVLKQLLVILAGANEKAQFMLTMVKGAVFFGTPSRGMPMGQLRAMVGDQPNKDLLKDLSDKSKFLHDLQTQFSGISFIQSMKLYWAYETETSPTVQEINGLYKRSGPRCIMVDRQSATGSCALDLSFTIQIDEDHSNMVKFNRGDRRIPTIISKIKEIYGSSKMTDEIVTFVAPMGVVSDSQLGSDTSYRGPDLLEGARKSELMGWDYDLIVLSLKAARVDQRYEHIDSNFGHTFSWAFENSKIGLSQWLRKGEGIFWINGKPGSGKSTFMKFLLNDSRTTELLHQWKSMPGRITANFFFNHRGTHLQKSFKGLMRSLFGQLLNGDRRLRKFLGVPQSEKSADLYEAIQSDVYSFFQLCDVETSNTTHQKRTVALLAENPCLQLHRILEEEASHMIPEDRFTIKQTLLRDFTGLGKSARVEEDVSVEEDIHEKMNPREKEKRMMCQKLLLEFPTDEEPIRKILNRWYESMDTSTRIRQLLPESMHISSQTRKLLPESMDISSRTRRILEDLQLKAPKSNDEQHLTELLGRQKAHEQRLTELLAAKARLIRLVNDQLMWWTQVNPEEGMQQIVNQTTFDLEVCLLFDALDEYDGSPEVISAFMKDLVEMKPLSKTRIRILFSSRPWSVFHDHFDTCPTISIHEHTIEDIQEYCAGSIPDLRRTRTLIRPFVEEIANRARGVFVWVKLVMAELATIVVTNVETDKQLSQRLRKCLDSLPDELEDFYSRISRRLPSSTRMQSYILLECLSRSSGAIPLDEIPSLLACGMSESLFEAQNSVRNQSAPGSEDPRGHLRTISGGLVDLVPQIDVSSRKKEKHTLQLMHQTVKDWVALPTFKHTILEARVAITWQNGHSFLAKYYIHRIASGGAKSLRNEIIDHAEKAEMTTGVSQYKYLSQLPRAILADVVEDANASTDELLTTARLSIDAVKERELEQSLEKNRRKAHMQWQYGSASYGLELAALGGLSCYLKDFIETEPLVFQQSTGPLLSISLIVVRYKSAKHHPDMMLRHFEWMKLILENGFQIRSDPAALSFIFEGIWTSTDEQTSRMYMDLVMAAVRNGLPIGDRFDISLEPGSPTSLLHISPPILAEFLLEHGADPNRLNMLEQTPLDYILESGSVFQICGFGLDWLYDVVRLLIKSGAKQRRVTKDRQRLQGQNLLQRLEDNGYDIGPLLSLREGSLGLGEENASLFTRMFGGSRGRLA
ncbi:hypothetical protein G7054_g8109 [Neopestalotiopsis clavispora]|nr:hypothetical protein G7054_g8109 [Neopestalotiopsis clavispora]